MRIMVLLTALLVIATMGALRDTRPIVIAAGVLGAQG